MLFLFMLHQKTNPKQMRPNPRLHLEMDRNCPMTQRIKTAKWVQNVLYNIFRYVLNIAYSAGTDLICIILYEQH